MKIGLSAGHSVAHPGAYWHEATEHWRMRDVVDFAVQELAENGHKVWEPGYAYDDPDDTRDLTSRIEYYNEVRLDCVVELHMDVLIEPGTEDDPGGPVPITSIKGFYGIYMPGSSGGQSLVESICGELGRIDALPGHHKPDRDHGGRYALTRNTRAWAAIIEVGFISNPETAEYFLDPTAEHCQHVGQAVARGIMEWGASST